MDNQILSGILAEYEKRREENGREEERRRREAIQRCPGLEELMHKRHEMILSSVRSTFADAPEEDPEARMQEYNQKISSLLTVAGLPGDYLSPVCRCEKCGDTGYVYDRSVRKICDCLEKAYQAALDRAGQGGQSDATFSTFDFQRFPDAPLPGTDVTQREYMGVVKQKCEKFAVNVPAGPVKTLLLHGGSGLGKTFLLNCVAADARSRGVETVYVTAYDLLMDLKNAYFSRGGESAQGYFDAKLLLIDDLGMEPMMANVTVEQIYNLLNARLLRGLYTAVSTNLSRTELQARYTERVSSRLLDQRTGESIPFLGRDIRLMKEGNRA